MKATELVLLCLTCFLALAFRSVYCDSTTPIVPSATPNITCPGLKDCKDGNCTFMQTNTTIHEQKRTFGHQNEILKCDKMEVTIKYDGNIKDDFYFKENISCITYGNQTYNFTVMEVVVTKPDIEDKDLTITCKYGDKNCTLVNHTGSEFTYVVGMPENCTVYSEQTTTPAPPTTTPAPPTTTTPPTTAASTPNATNATTPDQKSGTTPTPAPTSPDSPGKSGGDGDKKKDGSDKSGQSKLTSAVALMALALIVSLLVHF